MTSQKMPAASKIEAFAKSRERDRRAFEMMFADKTLSFPDAIKKIMDEEDGR